jgi:hypothetical protein
VNEVNGRADNDQHWSLKIGRFKLFGFGCTAGQKKLAANALRALFIDKNPVPLDDRQKAIFKKAIQNGRLGSICKELGENSNLSRPVAN